MARIISVIGWVILTFTSALIVFKINLHSDSLFLDAVMIDIFSNGGAWGDWKITPAPAYFPDMLIYAVSYFLIPTPAMRITFVCVIQALLLAFACVNFGKIIQPLRSNYQSNLILVFVSAFALVAANSSMWLFFNSTNNHFAALLFPLLIGWMIFRYWDLHNISSIFWITLFVFFGAASTPVFALSFTAPFFIFSFLTIIAFRNEKAIRNFFIKVLACVLIGHIAASTFNTVMLSYDAFDGRAPATFEAAQRSLVSFINATKLTFDGVNIFTFTLSAFSAIAISIIIFDFLKSLHFFVEISKNSTSKFFLSIPTYRLRYYVVLIFFVIALPVCVLGSIASGGFADPWGYRYFSLPIALGLLLFIVRFDEKINKQIRENKFIVNYMVLSLLLIIAVLGALSTKNLFLNSGRTSAIYLLDKGIRNSQDEVAECIKREAGAGFKFQAGVADYWSSRGVIYKTENIPYILPVTNDLHPFFWMMTLGPLLSPEKYNAMPYNFLIAKKPGTTTQFNLTPEVIGRLAPSPSKIIDCENTDSSLWLYSDMQLDEVVRKNISNFLFRLGRSQKFLMPGSAFYGQTGRVETTLRVAYSNKDSPGFLAYGPYIKIPKGKYRAVISYEATEAGNRWDAGRFNDPNKNFTVGSGDFPVGQGVVNFDFEIDNPLEQFEIRVWFDGRGSIVLNSISLIPEGE